LNPAPKTFSVRLEFQFPEGTLQTMEGGPIETRYQRPEPGGEQQWAVLPVTGTALGTICAKVEYGSSMFAVKAFVYPALLYPPSPGPAHPFPSNAADGVSTDGGFVWRWKVGNAVPGADHTASPGAADRLAIWFKPTSSSGYTFDGSTPFFGVTNPYPCGSVSGSNSAIGWMDELAAMDMLLVTIPEGPLQGHHHAKRYKSRVWLAETRRESLTIAVEPPGNLVLRAGPKIVESKRIESKPFLAVFSGKELASRSDVVVTPA
jgi:hypothetical protein